MTQYGDTTVGNDTDRFLFDLPYPGLVGQEHGVPRLFPINIVAQTISQVRVGFLSRALLKRKYTDIFRSPPPILNVYSLLFPVELSRGLQGEGQGEEANVAVF